MSRRNLKKKVEERLNKEKGTVYKDPGGKTSVCLVYPNNYHVGMSSLGFQGVYGLLNERDDVLCERAFLPDQEDIEEYERTRTEVFSYESMKPLGKFDILAFSVSFENDYPNILKILQLSNIPLDSSRRGPGHPLLIMGGVCAMSNPEPLADFFDVVFVGEAEEMLDEFMDIHAISTSKDALFRKALKIEGVYVPRFYGIRYAADGLIMERYALEDAPEVIRRRGVKDISGGKIRHSITTPETEFSDMRLVEAMRGCPWNCSFCLVGHLLNPPRKKGLKAIKEEIKGSERVGLIGPSLSDYPHGKEVLGMEGVDFSITSLRAGRRSAELVGMLRGRKSVSMAPEAGTERMRNHVNKKIKEKDILETAAMVFEHGIQRLRLYFMVGLPSETDEDIEGLVNLVHAIRSTSKKGSITITLSTFIPKPFTPFQRYPMTDMKTVKERMKMIKKSLRAERGVKVFHDVPKYAYMQGMFSVGDRRVGAALKAMLLENDWRRASTSAGVDPDFYTMREKMPEESLPWDFIQLC
jgi:radical SAM superfamily enzyme YgiQ (UPF0313 family)